MPSAVQNHDELVARSREQRLLILAEEPGVDYWSRPDEANRNAGDPHRQFDPIEEAISSYLRPDDVLLDVGGGAGRLALALARCCKQVVIVDPSAGMRAEFEAVVAEAGISNARYVQQDWLEADDIKGDVTLVAHVTYYVPDIRRFVEKLAEASRRRVILNLMSVPPPNLTAAQFAVIHGTPQALLPSHRELLPALWEMGILPDVQVFPPPPGATETVFPTREFAITAITVLASSIVPPIVPQGDPVRSRQIIDQHFDEIFVSVAGGFLLPRPKTPRLMIITWETAQP
jgi:SAM-dependent methyltransferase